MKILGIDPGSIVTGYGVVEHGASGAKAGSSGTKGKGRGGGGIVGGRAQRSATGAVAKGGSSSGLLHVCEGVIKLKCYKTLPERLLAIYRSLGMVIEEHRPDAVAVESVFHARNARSAIMLGHARGAAILTAAEHGLQVFEYSPSSVKQSVTGHGGAAKEQVQKMVGILLNRPATAEADAADALAVAICHINSFSSIILKASLKTSAASFGERPRNTVR